MVALNIFRQLDWRNFSRTNQNIQILDTRKKEEFEVSHLDECDTRWL